MITANSSDQILKLTDADFEGRPMASAAHYTVDPLMRTGPVVDVFVLWFEPRAWDACTIFIHAAEVGAEWEVFSGAVYEGEGTPTELDLVRAAVARYLGAPRDRAAVDGETVDATMPPVRPSLRTPPYRPVGSPPWGEP